MTTKEKKLPVTGKEMLEDSGKRLILFNDDINTFDFVIETLIEVCGHDAHQAENCTLIAHFKGKCAIKAGTLSDLELCYKTMILKQLTVEIQ